MEQTKYNTIPFRDTIDFSEVLGQKILTKDGEKIGKVKSVHINPKTFSLDGIVMNTGLFDADQYLGTDFIGSVTDEGIVLKIRPVTEYVGLSVFDFTGKEIGKVKDVNRSRQSNTLFSMVVDRHGKEDVLISAGYIAATGKNIVLKEAYPF